MVRGGGGRRVRIELLDRTLFVRKTISVFAASFVLLPLLEFRSAVPALLYALSLVVLHVIVLIIYLYRVPVRQLASSWRGVAVRVLALAVVLYLLVLLSSFDEDASRTTLSLQLFAVAVLHAVVLLLISARLHRGGGTSSPAAVTPESPASGSQ
jgi:hypothetical protein